MAESIAYNIDCMAYMRTLPDKCFDLAVVDPPYGIGEGDGKNHFSRGVLAKAREYKKFEDKEPPQEEYFRELTRVSKNQIIWGANHFVGRIPNPSSSCWIVWDKENGENDFADCELAYTSFKTAVRIFRFRWQGMLQGNADRAGSPPITPDLTLSAARSTRRILIFRRSVFPGTRRRSAFLSIDRQ